MTAPLCVIAFIALQRLSELVLSRRNFRKLASQGAVELYSESFRGVFSLHLFFLLSLLAESYPWRTDWNYFNYLLLGIFASLQILRYWAIASLGENWNTRIVIVPGGPSIRRGPYRFLRHPNYLAVTLEFFVVPLLMETPLTLLVFFPANLMVLRKRIRLEEKALLAHTDYRNRFGAEEAQA